MRVIILLALSVLRCATAPQCETSIAAIAKPLKVLRLPAAEWSTITASTLSSAGLTASEHSAAGVISMSSETRAGECSCCATYYLRDGHLTQVVVIRRSESPSTLDDELAVLTPLFVPAAPPLLDERRDDLSMQIRDVQWDLPGGATYHFQVERRELAGNIWQLRLWATQTSSADD
jgi:hypothetical protein